MSKCRKAFFGLGKVGMNHACVSPEVKGHLWRTICCPTLTYGIECLSLTATQMKALESTQGTLIKSSLRIGKRSRSSSLLKAMAIQPVKDTLKQKTVSLYHSVCQVPGPASDVCLEQLREFNMTGQVTHGTLLARVLESGTSPIHAALYKPRMTKTLETDGIVDSIKQLICHENFLKPHSDELNLVRLLTRSF